VPLSKRFTERTFESRAFSNTVPDAVVVAALEDEEKEEEYEEVEDCTSGIEL
jgi:hypothetical protein